jgi:hypothetical protein
MHAAKAQWSGAKTMYLLGAVAGGVLAVAGIIFGSVQGFTWPVVLATVVGAFLMASTLYWGFIRRPRPSITLRKDQ